MNKEMEVSKAKSEVEKELVQLQEVNIPPSNILRDYALYINRNHPLQDNSAGLQNYNEKCEEIENIPPLSSGHVMLETAVRSDVSYLAETPADSCDENVKDQDFFQQTDTISLQMDPKFSLRDESFLEKEEIPEAAVCSVDVSFLAATPSDIYSNYEKDQGFLPQNSQADTGSPQIDTNLSGKEESFLEKEELPETAVISDDASFLAAIPADIYYTNEKYEEFLQQNSQGGTCSPQIDTNLSGKEESVPETELMPETAVSSENVSYLSAIPADIYCNNGKYEEFLQQNSQSDMDSPQIDTNLSGKEDSVPETGVSSDDVSYLAAIPADIYFNNEKYEEFLQQNSQADMCSPQINTNLSGKKDSVPEKELMSETAVNIDDVSYLTTIPSGIYYNNEKYQEFLQKNSQADTGSLQIDTNLSGKEESVPEKELMPETAVSSDDVSCLAAIPAVSCANNDEFQKEAQELLQQTSQLTDTVSPQSGTSLSGKEKSLQEDLEMLLKACQDENSQSRTPDFYCAFIESLNENHIYELLKEKDKLDIEFQQALKKLEENRTLTTKRLNTIENILSSSKVVNKFSKLQIDEVLVKEKSEIQVIKSKMTDSVGCYNVSTIINDSKLTETFFVSQSNIKMEENEAKKQNVLEVAEEVNHKQESKQNVHNKLIIEQHSHSKHRETIKPTRREQILIENLIEQIVEQNSHGKQRETTQNEQILFKNFIEQFFERNSHSKQRETIAPTQREQILIENLIEQIVEQNSHGKQRETTQREHILLKIFIEQFFEQNSHSKQREANIEINRISRELRKSQDELKTVKDELEDKINSIRQHAHHEQKRIMEINTLEMEVKKFKRKFLHAQEELKDVKNELMEKVLAIQKAKREQEELELFKEKDELLLNLVRSLRNELAETENELEAVKKDLKEKDDTIEHMTQHDMKELEAEVVVLQRQLAGAQNELTVVQRELHFDILTIQEKNQQEQKLMEELHKAKESELQNWLSATEEEAQQKLNKEQEKVNKLQNQLAATQHKLEAVTKELNNTVNSLEQNIKREQKLAEVGFREIRMMLVKKLGFANEKSHHFESYMKEERCRGIVSDIRRLIKDKVELWKEPVIGSSTLQVTENEVHLVVAMACFLKVVPFSASTHFIYSFVAQIDNVISCQDVEGLLKKFPTLFNEETVGAGSSSKTWKYMDLKPIITI